MAEVGVAETPAVPQGLRELQTLKDAGFSDDEIVSHKAKTTGTLLRGGFTPEEIDKHWGESTPVLRDLLDHQTKNLAAVAPEQRSKVAESPGEMLAAGWGMSVAGLAIHGKPTMEMPKDPSLTNAILSGVGQFAGDFPAIVAGFAGGAAVGSAVGPVGSFLGAGGGSAGLPQAMREILLGAYRRDEISSWKDFATIAGQGLLNTGKATLAGVVAAPAGKLGEKVVSKVAGPFINGGANAVTQATTFAATMGALDGHVPDKQDFIAGAVLAIGFHSAGALVGGRFQPNEAGKRVQWNLEEIYRSTGVPPWQIIEQAKTDPVLRQELIAQNVVGEPVLSKLKELAPPEPVPYDPQGITTRQAANPMWLFDPRYEHMNVTRRTADNRIIPQPEAVATYLQKFGELAGFKFQVGPGASEKLMSNNDGMSEAAPFFQSASKGGRARGFVYITDNTDPQFQRWMGLNGSEILYHEVGHALDAFVLNVTDKQHGRTTDKLKPGIQDELEAASRQFKPLLWGRQAEYNMKPSELMADAIAVWLSNPTMRAQMPKFTEEYGAQLRPYLEMANNALPTRNENGSWSPPPGGAEAGAGAGGTGGGQPPGPPRAPAGPPPPLPKRIEGREAPKLTTEEIHTLFRERIGEPPLPESLLQPDRMYRQMVSELGPVRAIDKLLAEQGYDLSKNVGLEDMFRQTYASDARAGYFVRYGILDPITFERKGTASVMTATKMVQDKKGNVPDWVNYMLAKRTLDKAKEGIETGFDIEQAGQLVKAEKGKYEAATTEFNKVARGVLEYGRDSGIFSQKQIDAMSRANPAYISLRRVLGDTKDMRLPNGKGFKPTNPLHAMEGSDLQIVNPLLATLDNFRVVVAMADRNRAIGSVITLAEQHGISPKLGLKELPAPEIKATIAEPGSDVFKPYGPGYTAPGVKEAFEPFLAERASRKHLSADKFPYYRDGKIEIWRATDPDLAALLRGADSQGEANIVVQTFNAFAQVQRTGITASPDFPFRTGLRDQIGTFIADPLHPPPVFTGLRGVMSVLKADEHYQRWVANGGAGAALVNMDANYLVRDMHALFESTGTWGSLWNTFRHPMEAAQALNERLDAMARVGYMKRAEDQGLSPLKAATMGRKAYLDFVEKGTSEFMQKWARMVPFMRPHILGLKQLGEAAVNHPGTSLALASLAVTLPTVMLYALNYLQDEYGDLPEDRKYRNLSRWMKDTMYVLPEIGGVRMKIPNPPNIGIAFGGFPVRFLDYFAQSDPKAFEGWAYSTLASFLPPLVPTMLTPVIEGWADRKFFNGKPLIPASLERASPDMMYTENTTEVAKAVSRALGGHSFQTGAINVSPIVLENYVREWTGTVGMGILRALNAPLNASGRPWEVADIPFVQAFVVRNPKANAQPISDFFDEQKKMTQAFADQRLAIKRASLGVDNAAEVEQMFEVSAVKMDGIASALHMQQASLIAVNNDKTLTNDEKRQFATQIYSDMILTAKGGLEMIQSFREEQ